MNNNLIEVTIVFCRKGNTEKKYTYNCLISQLQWNDCRNDPMYSTLYLYHKDSSVWLPMIYNNISGIYVYYMGAEGERKEKYFDLSETCGKVISSGDSSMYHILSDFSKNKQDKENLIKTKVYHSDHYLQNKH